jgi:hypothetical protein
MSVDANKVRELLAQFYRGGVSFDHSGFLNEMEARSRLMHNRPLSIKNKRNLARIVRAYINEQCGGCTANTGMEE